MRLLSIGYPLPHPSVDNASVFSAPSLFDYDAMVIDPAGLSRAVQGVLDQSAEAMTVADLPVINGPGSPLAIGLADILKARAAEAERLLARGGVIIVVAQPNVAVHGVAGFPGCDRYFWLPAPSGLTWDRPDLVMANGKGAVPTDYAHPLAGLIDQLRDTIQYRAYFSERAALGKGASVFARSPGGAPIGVDFALNSGRIVFIPASDTSSHADRATLASMLFDGAREMLNEAPPEDPPFWANDFTLPGLAEREAEMAEAEAALDQAEARLAEASAGAEALERFRRMLWDESGYRLSPLVHDALRLLGFDVRGEIGEPATLYADGRTTYIEVQGATGAVDMTPHYRLRERREQELSRSGTLPGGLIVVNGERQRHPSTRANQYIDALRVAAESMQYGILTASDLFLLTQRALARADDDWKADMRRRIMSAAGPIDLGIEDMEDIPSRPTAH